jgi:hypothetical protein
MKRAGTLDDRRHLRREFITLLGGAAAVLAIEARERFSPGARPTGLAPPPSASSRGARTPSP